jgi:lipoyl(octanoyl) transferase
MKINIIKLGKMKYGQSLEIQQKLFNLRLSSKISDTLLFVEHFPVITLGKRGNANNITACESTLGDNGVEVHRISRGGDVTYHGDGQLVGYLIFDVRNHGRGIKDFVYMIEETVIRLLKDVYGIGSVRGEKKYTGIWIGDRKIAAFGIFVSHWITMHGFSFNVNPDMSHFKWINPCGITDKGVTSLEMETGRKIGIDEVTSQFLDVFKDVFRSDCELTTLESLLDGVRNA